MLSFNIEHVHFTRSISKKLFNRFLKHWIRGSNPRLQCMFLSIDKIDSVNGEIYLKGIDWIEMSEEAKRDIRQKRRLSVSVDMIQIRRTDGTTAVIGTNDSGNILHVRFIVLH
ncbi:hypothetical protein CRE_13298 [Caenorhabditis remanei]|uniref:Sdz-33 F-box domain-containing protein n=1 Tax=Caenorhabditis remanei TaxID=31234 RepID=E3M827_CAERE|nr:hypothetical protein CRE_13298 [Caenorhabditis remanei]